MDMPGAFFPETAVTLKIRPPRCPAKSYSCYPGISLEYHLNYPQENPGKQVKKYYDHPTLCYVVYSFSKNIPSITSLVEPFSSNLIIVLVVIFSFSAQFSFWFGNFICICNEEFSRKNVFHHPKHVIVLCRLNFF